jgi:hypothetical protein
MGAIVGASTLLHVVKSMNGRSRTRGEIERRGNSFRVRMYAGVDPLTGKRLYLTDSTTDEAEARRILTRFRAEVDEQRNARCSAWRSRSG